MGTNDINTRGIEHTTLAQFKRRLRSAIQAWTIGLFSNIDATVDSTSGTPSVTPSYNDGQLTLAFAGLKGSSGATPLFRINNNGHLEVSYDAGSTWEDKGQVVGTNGQDGTGVDIKPNAQACVEIGNAYIDQTTGHLMILTTLPDSFTDGGEIKGPKGDNGDNAYLHIKYADSSNPADTDMHDTPATGDEYIGVCSDNSSSAPTTSASYQWSKYVGQDGAPGQDGSKWYNSTAISGTSGDITGPSDSNSYNQGDYLLNPSSANVYRCKTGGTGSNSVWNYVGNIKGTGLQYNWNGTSLGVKRENESSYSYVNLKGDPGRDGSVVSKAYRFIPSLGYNESSIYGWGDETWFLEDALADIRITINEDTEMANVHLTVIASIFLDKSAHNPNDWPTLMANIGAYGGGSSWVGFINGGGINNAQGDEFRIPEYIPTKLSEEEWYGSIIVRHEDGWDASQPKAETVPVLIDVHGIIPIKAADIEKLFVDGTRLQFGVS